MKKNLLLLGCILLAHTMYGQSNFVKSNQTVKLDVTEKSRTTEDHVALTYCLDDLNTNGLGLRNPGTLEAAVYFPASKLSRLEGNSIKSIKIAILDTRFSNITVWITSKLGEKNIYSQNVPSVVANWNEIELTTPYVIDGSPIYVGFSGTQPNGVYPLSLVGEDIQGGAYIGTGSASSWENLYGGGYGCLSLQCIVTGDNLPQLDMSLESVEPVYGQLGQEFKLSGIVKNNAAKIINSYDVSYQIGSNEAISQTIETTLGNNNIETFSIDGVIPMEPGEYDLTVTIEKINSLDDEFVTDNTLNATLNAIKFIYPKKIVVEEGTGTWCGWCPRGIVGLEKMHEKYPESFIGIAVHNGDPMTVTSYSNSLGAYFSGYPNSITNRKKKNISDPNFTDLENIYLNEMAIPADIGISLTANFKDETNSKIVARATTTFGFESTTANYKIAYILMEHKVSGYNQANSYAGGANGPMGGFEKLPASVAIDFNDVARGIYQYNGIAGSIPTTVNENAPITHEYEITIPSTIKNKTELELVAILINGKTGEIINADKSEISPSTSNINQDITTNFVANAFVLNKQLNIEIDKEGEFSIDLYTIGGQKVLTKEVYISGKSIIQIPASELKGIYLIKINYNDNFVIKKIVL